MRRIDWLNNKEPDVKDSAVVDIKINQLWKKYAPDPGKKGNEKVYIVSSIKESSVTLKELLNLYGKGINISADELRNDYIFTNIQQVKQIPRYANLALPSFS